MPQRALPADLDPAVENIAEVAGLLWQRGWAEYIGGNISVNVSDIVDISPSRYSKAAPFPLVNAYPGLGNAVFLVTGTMTRMRDVARYGAAKLCLLQLDAQGKSCRLLWRGAPELRPTSEFNSHLAIHHTNIEIGRDARALVHTHPTEIIALTHLAGFQDGARINRILWSMMPEAMICFPDGAGFAPYAMTGSPALEAISIEVVRKHRVCMWEKHGCLAVDKDVQAAFDILDTVNKCARLYLLCRHAGEEPQGIPESEVEALREKFAGGY